LQPQDCLLLDKNANYNGLSLYDLFSAECAHEHLFLQYLFTILIAG